MSVGRTLATAREVLRVLKLLYEHPEGLTAKEVAAILGKSVYTAYYLLNTLCQENFALRLERGVYVSSDSVIGSKLKELQNVALEVNLASKCRSYLVSLKGEGTIWLEASFGHQGQVGPSGLIRRLNWAAHALAVGKAVIAQLGPKAKSLLSPNPPKFTPNTLSVDSLQGQLIQVLCDGIAYDIEEYQQGVCCIAVPLRYGEFIGALGLALPTSRFLKEGDKLADWLRRQVHKEEEVRYV